jgi:hypothetical protein
MLINHCGKCNKTITVDYAKDTPNIHKRLKCPVCHSILYIELASNGFMHTFKNEEEELEFISKEY